MARGTGRARRTRLAPQYRTARCRSPATACGAERCRVKCSACHGRLGHFWGQLARCSCASCSLAFGIVAPATAKPRAGWVAASAAAAAVIMCALLQNVPCADCQNSWRGGNDAVRMLHHAPNQGCGKQHTLVCVARAVWPTAALVALSAHQKHSRPSCLRGNFVNELGGFEEYVWRLSVSSVTDEK
jgi:hypothetical protein